MSLKHIFPPIFPIPIPIFPVFKKNFRFEEKGMHPCMGDKDRDKVCRQKISQIIIIWLGDSTEKSHRIWSYFPKDQNRSWVIRGGEVGKFMCVCESGACYLCVHNIDASEPHSSESLAPPPPPPFSLVSLSQSCCELPVNLTNERGEGVGGGAKSYDGEKAWSSINHSILSAQSPQK